MDHERFLHEAYRRHPESGAFIIDVDLDRYADVFNEWDRGPLRRRDIDPDLLFFLKACSSDIPLDQPIRLSLSLSKPQQDPNKESWITEGLRNYFAFCVYGDRQELKKNRKTTLRLLGIAFVFLTVVYLIKPYWSHSLMTEVFSEGLMIGGWVFLWEAISSFAFHRRDVLRSLREQQRFLDAPIDFQYYEPKASPPLKEA